LARSSLAPNFPRLGKNERVICEKKGKEKDEEEKEELNRLPGDIGQG